MNRQRPTYNSLLPVQINPTTSDFLFNCDHSQLLNAVEYA